MESNLPDENATFCEEFVRVTRSNIQPHFFFLRASPRSSIMAPKNNYQPYLVKLLSFVDDREYTKEDIFEADGKVKIPVARLLEIRPEQIVGYMCKCVYGTADPTDDDKPEFGRSSTLQYIKKALSSFMPNKHMAWNETSAQGNPTKSPLIHELLRRVKKEEVRGQGAPSQARRPLTDTEFRRTVALLRNNATNDARVNMVKYGIPALMTFNFSMIGRIDDGCMFFTEHLKAHDKFPSQALKARLRWSKNVMDERSAPWQTLLGAMDATYCVFINLGLWLEVQLSSSPHSIASPYIFSFSEDITRPGGGVKANSAVSRVMREVFSANEFDFAEGPLGTHSIRKFAATYVRDQGVNKDDKDVRGRWKADDARRASHVYDDVHLPYVDTRVCGVLCVGGPCSYLEKEGSGVTSHFILQHVTPCIRNKFGESVALIFGRAIMWLCFSEKREIVPAEMFARITVAYNNEILPDSELQVGDNPIDKKLLIVTGDRESNAVNLTEVDDAAVNGGQGQQGGELGGQTSRDMLMALMSRMSSLERGMASNINETEQLRALLRQQHRVAMTNLRQIGREPHRAIAIAAGRRQQQQQVAAGGGAAAVAGLYDANATLSPNPRSLSLLWTEYIEGLGGRKPAKYFTAAERGRCKHKYHRRNVFWKAVCHMVNGGHDSRTAIDLIYNIYGEGQSVTNIINGLKRDKRNNTLHPNLRF